MPAVKKVIDDKNVHPGNGIVSEKVKDRSTDPYFVKKAEHAKAFLQKNGLNGIPYHNEK